MACTCSAYPFPHRPLAGACNGERLLSDVLNAGVWCECCDAFSRVDESEGRGSDRVVRFVERCDVRDPRDCPGVLDCLRPRRGAA